MTKYDFRIVVLEDAFGERFYRLQQRLTEKSDWGYVMEESTVPMEPVAGYHLPTIGGSLTTRKPMEFTVLQSAKSHLKAMISKETKNVVDYITID